MHLDCCHGHTVECAAAIRPDCIAALAFSLTFRTEVICGWERDVMRMLLNCTLGAEKSLVLD